MDNFQKSSFCAERPLPAVVCWQRPCRFLMGECRLDVCGVRACALLLLDGACHAYHFLGVVKLHFAQFAQHRLPEQQWCLLAAHD